MLRAANTFFTSLTDIRPLLVVWSSGQVLWGHGKAYTVFHQTPGKSTVDRNVSTEAMTSAEGWRNSLQSGRAGSRRSLKVDGVFHSLEAMMAEVSMWFQFGAKWGEAGFSREIHYHGSAAPCDSCTIVMCPACDSRRDLASCVSNTVSRPFSESL